MAPNNDYRGDETERVLKSSLKIKTSQELESLIDQFDLFG